MSSPSFLRRRAFLLLVIALLLATGAYAWFSAQGAGEGSATVGTATPFELSSTTVGDLYPGGPALTVPIAIHNLGQGNQRIGTIHGTVADNGGCLGSWFEVDDVNYNQTIGPGATANTDTQIRMLESGSNQNACQDKTMTINWATDNGGGNSEEGPSGASVGDVYDVVDGSNPSWTSTNLIVFNGGSVHVSFADGSGAHLLVGDPAERAVPSHDGSKIAYEADQDLYYQEIDANGDAVGSPVFLATANWYVNYAWSPNDRYIAWAGGNDVYYADTQDPGTAHNITQCSCADTYSSSWRPAWGPQSDRIAYSVFGYIDIVDLSGNLLGEINRDYPHWYQFPAWAENGRLAYLDNIDFPPTWSIVTNNAADTNSRVIASGIYTSGQDTPLLDWSPAGDRVAFAAHDGGVGAGEDRDLFIAADSANAGFTNLTGAASGDDVNGCTGAGFNFAWSPSGSWITFEDNTGWGSNYSGGTCSVKKVYAG